MNVLTVSVRDFQASDIQKQLDYWYRSPAGYLESIGVDPARLPSESEMAANLAKVCGKSEIPAVTILVNQCAIGVHLVAPVVRGESAVFHAHIWDASWRGKGVATRSYPLACEIFFKRFQLKRIDFKTPLQNIGAIRVKEKLGILVVGEEELATPIGRSGLRARCFEWTLSEFENFQRVNRQKPENQN